MPCVTDHHEQLVEHIRDLARSKAPVLVALDGRSGAGKSSLAKRVAHEFDAVIIEGDDFYAGGTPEQWDAMTPEERAGHCIDWPRQRQLLEALAAGSPATYRPYDWEVNDGSLAAPASVSPAAVVILEGAYSARPELSDLIDLRVLLHVDDPVRERRLRQREGEHYRAEWEAR
jgi:uridine kinase